MIEGQPYEPVRYGDEWLDWGQTRRRHDCHVLPGQVHHHGCDVEECPACGEQSVGCDCVWAGEESEDAFRWRDPANQT